MMKLFADIDTFLEGHLLKPDPALEEIARRSDAEGLVPHAVSPLQATFLALLIRMSGAKHVLEIGCLGGYSAVAMARALPENGRLITTEIDTRTAEVAKQNILVSGLGDRIDLRVGPALDELERLIAADVTFDFIFIDADKVNHQAYLERSLKLSKPGTIIVADNIVRGGAVLDAHSQENSVRGVREFMAYAQTLSGVDMTAIQTVGAKGHDGMALFRVGAECPLIRDRAR